MAEFHTMPRDPMVAELMRAQRAEIAGEPLPPLRPAIDHAERALRVQAMQFAVMAQPMYGAEKVVDAANQFLTFLKGGDAPVDATETEA